MVPLPIHAEVVRRLEADMLEQYGSLTRMVEVPNQLSLVFVRKL
jgi:hypothetical protein